VFVLYTFAGDANLNGVIDQDDFDRVNANQGTTSPSYAKGDFNYDGVINGTDVAIINRNFALSVPEPAMVLAPLLGLLSVRRRRHR